MSSNKKVKTLSITEDLDSLLKKRNGGAVNFRGIQYQILYSCHLILKNLWNSKNNESITLEGLEDLDHKQTKLTVSTSEFIQLKSSENKLNAGVFWNMEVLQNFLQVYLANNSSSFKLVYNFKASDGALKQLFENTLTDKTLGHWESKLNDYTAIPFDIKDFFEKISFEKITFDEITNSIRQLLFKHWNINKGTERQFVNALVNSALQWSKDRTTVTHQTVLDLFEDVKNSYSKAIQNDAVKNNWIERVDYLSGSPADLITYYDGKAAKPSHIGNGLPAQRKYWEKKIIESVKTHDIVLIRSSSGQGKSTLAWRVGYILKDRHTIYQLHSSKTWEQANSSMEFLESRVALGEFPIVIIDGLDADVDHWQMLVQRTALMPVRYIITSRHEDWSRYGADISTISLIPVDISMGREEAEDIFNQFRIKGKLHHEITDWQPIWEQVFEKGLLIEYTYLLTRGEMINERLSKQLQKLKDDRAPAAKTEILRIVAAADCLQINIQTQNLINHIHKTVSFSNQDRGEVLAELQNEYFINFNGKKIEGLHPIRSMNLLELLHQALPLSETFINLYHLVDQQDKQDYFQHILLFLDKEDRIYFYNGISKVLQAGTYLEMVYALNGISYGEPQNYWLENKEAFDEVFKTGGLDFFILLTIPGKPLNTLDEVINSLPEQMSGNFIKMREIIKTLPKYTFKQTDVSIMAAALLENINFPNPFKPSYLGLGHLAKWYMKLDLKLTLQFNSEFLSQSLKSLSLEEIIGLFQFAQLADRPLYDRYVLENKEDIINFLRKMTVSLAITEYDNHIIIDYIYDVDSSETIIQQSLKRIESVYNLLPYYQKYDTKVIMLPFPSEEVISVMKSDGEKSLSPDYIPDSSEAAYSSIWIKTISRNYQESSAFQWQKNILVIRNNAAQWCMSSVRIIEAVFEGNSIKRDRELKIFTDLRSQLNHSLTPIKPYPNYARTMPDTAERIKSEKLINDWFFKLRNATVQFINLLSPQGGNDQNLTSINLQSLYFNLEEMQSAFHKMEKLTAVYFDSLDTDKNEKIIYERLYRSTLYVMEHLPVNDNIPVKSARASIDKWYDQHLSAEMADLKKILDTASLITEHEFILPARLQKTETITSVVIGIKGFDFTKENSLLLLAGSLSSLAEYPAAFFTVITIQNGTAAGGLRFKKDFFNILNNFDESRMDELMDNQPLPIIPDHEHASILGIAIKEPDLKSSVALKSQVLMEMWKMSRIRSMLNLSNAFDAEWLKELEDKQLEKIEKNIRMLSKSNNDAHFKNWIIEGFNSKKIWSDQDTIEEIIKLSLQETQQDLQDADNHQDLNY
jgi:hypothetical protein